MDLEKNVRHSQQKIGLPYRMTLQSQLLKGDEFTVDLI